MSSYKVPQDVEADDKLIGPFSFRQFIYLLIVAAAIAIAWGLSRLFIGLIIIPLPVILFFGALALPLRKDQPMEIYLAAIISFYLKPHQRLWDPDGIDSLIEVSAPKTVEAQRTKDLTQAEAEQRLGYLANLVDTQGWSVRGSDMPQNSAINSDVLLVAQQTEDIMDNNTSISRVFDKMISTSDEKHHQDLIESMKRPAPTPEPVPAAPTPTSAFAVPPQFQAPSADPSLTFNPYPNFNQTVIQPIDDPTHTTTAPVTTDVKTTTPSEPTPLAPAAPSTSVSEVSPDIMNLANNADLSIETIAREANRIEHGDDSGEVYVSLR